MTYAHTLTHTPIPARPDLPYSLLLSTFSLLHFHLLFQAVAIRKQGFPFRLTHDTFVKHYACIMPDPNKKCVIGVIYVSLRG